jgi:GNAT superfamily N-acetyltransferase
VERLYVAILWVDEEHRGTRCGSALLDSAERIAKDHGCEVVFLTTGTFQASASGFYEKKGYTKFAELPYGSKGFGKAWFSKPLLRPNS